MISKKMLRTLTLMAAGAAAFAGSCAHAAFFRPDVRPGAGVTGLRWLSDYHAPLKGTNFDAPVYVLDSGKPGATMLLIGGTHPREIAGHTTALVAIENARVTEGRLLVIPALNASGYGVRDESTNIARWHRVPSRSGMRMLPYGDRRLDINDVKTPDPDQYRHQSGATIPNSKGGDGSEMRNINRAYPGLPDGTKAQQITYAVMQLIRTEDVALNLDMHEANTTEWYLNPATGKTVQGGRLAYMLVCNPREEAMELGAEAVVNVGERVGKRLKIEPSNPAFRGLSHLEIGNASKCLSFLYETPNPGQDGWREVHNVISDKKYPLTHRVGLHTEIFKELVSLYSEYNDKRCVIEGLPTYEQLTADGFRKWLN